MFGMLVFFWSISGQMFTTWTTFVSEQTKNLVVNQLARPSLIQCLNPIGVLLLLPLTRWGLGVLKNRQRLEKDTERIFLGLLFATFGTFLLSAAWLTRSSSTCVVVLSVGAFLAITIGEIFAITEGLSLSFDRAPVHLRGLVKGLFWFSIFLGNLLNALISPLYDLLEPGVYFGSQGVIMIPVMVGFFFAARRFNRICETDADRNQGV